MPKFYLLHGNFSLDPTAMRSPCGLRLALLAKGNEQKRHSAAFLQSESRKQEAEGEGYASTRRAYVFGRIDRQQQASARAWRRHQGIALALRWDRAIRYARAWYYIQEEFFSPPPCFSPRSVL